MENNRKKVNPLGISFFILAIIIFFIVLFVVHSFPANRRETFSVWASQIPFLGWLILSIPSIILVVLGRVFLYKNKKDKKANVVVQQLPISNADELKKYKELLDTGIITQEEFDAKKKDLLK